MGVHVFVFKLVVEFSSDFDILFAFCSEDGRDGDVGNVWVSRGLGSAFFGQSFGRNDVCGGEGVGPSGEEDVVLEVGGDEVGDGIRGGESRDLGAYGVCEGDGGEDCQGSVLEFYCISIALACCFYFHIVSSVSARPIDVL